MPSVSAKQARLMSAIKHGWHPPAGMHAPPMAVAREFHAADKQVGKYMHAEGGKISTAAQVAKALANSSIGLYGEHEMAALSAKLREFLHKFHLAGMELEGHPVAPSAIPGAQQHGEDLLTMGVDPAGVVNANSLTYSDTHHAEGGRVKATETVDIADPAIRHDLTLMRVSPPPSKTNRFLQLVSHAADRATSTVTDDPHHVLARVASGLASQVAGRAPSGRTEFGRVPNLVDEIKSLPAGLTDVGMAGSNVLGALANRYLPHEPGGIGDILPRLARAANNYAAQREDPAPAWSRAAEGRTNAVHQGVNKAMGLSAPHGLTENTADALGVMLGQLPLPLAEAKTATRGVRGGLGALARAIPEYLGPTVRPSIRNYTTGAIGGGALGTLADSDPPPAPAVYGPLDKFE